MRFLHDFLFLAMLWLCPVVRAQGITVDGLTLAQSWTAHIRGTMEFDRPANVQIGAVGMRIPGTHTFTNP